MSNVTRYIPTYVNQFSGGHKTLLKQLILDTVAYIQSVICLTLKCTFVTFRNK